MLKTGRTGNHFREEKGKWIAQNTNTGRWLLALAQ